MGELTAFDAKAKPADDEAPSPKRALPRRTAAAFAVSRTAAPPIDALALLLDETTNAAIVRAALVSSVYCAAPMGLGCARALTRAGRGSFADASLFVAVMGGPDEFNTLLEDAAAGGSPATVAALGWYGNLDATDYLLGRLRGANPATKAAAA